ncbi:MAG TPA: hybrid sensor histidine kinase/response regulator, partial [Burkholderiales bacterium]|nr:hybrid sensor histidine kinase/response regulator [Burkholderiales bacterium]
QAVSMTEVEDMSRRRAAQVRAEQIRSVYSHSPTTTVASLITGVALVAVMWEQVDHRVLVGWLLALCAYQALRVYQYRVFVNSTPADLGRVRWDKRYIITTVVAGIIWGSAGVLMYVPGSLGHQAMLTVVLIGCATVAMTWLSYFAPAFYTLIPLMLAPVIVRMLMDPGPAHIYLGIPGLIALLVVLFFGRKVNCIIGESLHKHFENLDLIEQLRAQKAIAEAANRSKTQFFAAASHDLRQPLHAMGLFAGTLHQHIKDPKVLEVVHSINASVAALEGLFNELLDISKIDSGVIKPEPIHFPVSGLLAQLQDEFRVEANEKGLELRTVPSHRYACSDPLLVERILRNLISNALRYTVRGGVVVGCRWRPDRVRFEVWDSGPGIPAGEQEKIFEEFYQLHNPGRTSKKGLGLGLSIVQRLCNLLDCRVSIKSQPGRGTAFGFDVPLGTAPAETPSRAQTGAPAVADLAGRLIVVIDDEEAIVAGMRALLESWGADVIGSLSGDDVLTQVADHGRMPDLIIADYRLAGHVVGTEVIDQLREALDPDIPALLITASTAPGRITEADLRRYDLLLKPVQPERLRALIGAKLRVASV